MLCNWLTVEIIWTILELLSVSLSARIISTSI